MRRIRLLLLIVLAVCGPVAAGLWGTGANAQQATPATTGLHPLVGTWLLDTNTEDPANAPEVVIVAADGGYISVDAEGTTTLGVWKATGPRSAQLTIYQTGVLNNGAYGGIITVRAAVDVAPDGQTFTAEYTIGVIPPPGVEDQGEFGPGHASGTRLAPEAMGTPVGPLSDVQGGGEATPEATPAG
jgi:hypothetical protein